ncbi:MAG: aminopeptidase P family protein [Bacteroidetes bacterium]|nr:aminopeptidase P family protein [Bacteroidota bacterium]
MAILSFRKSLFILTFFVLSVASYAQQAQHRWRIMNQIRRDKFDLILPQVMKENQIDMWIITGREGKFDPLYRDLGAGYVGRNGYYVFFDKGNGRIERSVLGIDGYLLEQSGAWDYFGQESELKDFVLKRDPKKIGLNMSKDIGRADGLSYTEYAELSSILGKKYQDRFVSAEKLYSDFKSRHTATEIAAFAEAGNYSYQIAERALSNEIITPGVTRLEEVAWWMLEQLHAAGLESSFGMPSVYVTGPDGIVATSNDRIIQRGDILMIDWGVGYLSYYTDMKRIAYVLKEGEREVPAGIRHAFDQGVKARKVVTDAIKPGYTAQQNMDRIYAALVSSGFERMKEFNKPGESGKTDVMIGCHAVGDWGHGTGPSIAHFNPLQLTYTIRPTNLLSIELFAYTPLPEWGGKKLRIPLEDDAIVTDRGVEWVYPVNEKVLLIR